MTTKTPGGAVEFQLHSLKAHMRNPPRVLLVAFPEVILEISSEVSKKLLGIPLELQEVSQAIVLEISQ